MIWILADTRRSTHVTSLRLLILNTIKALIKAILEDFLLNLGEEFWKRIWLHWCAGWTSMETVRFRITSFWRQLVRLPQWSLIGSKATRHWGKIISKRTRLTIDRCQSNLGYPPHHLKKRLWSHHRTELQANTRKLTKMCFLTLRFRCRHNKVLIGDCWREVISSNRKLKWLFHHLARQGRVNNIFRLRKLKRTHMLAANLLIRIVEMSPSNWLLLKTVALDSNIQLSRKQNA